MAFPIDRASYRTLDPGWSGQVVVADIDRTYLATRFSTLEGMARIPFERAFEKRDIEGMARLLCELRRGPGATSRDTPLFFVSASPSQLRPVIERKMALDGIVFDGTTFKDWLGVARRGRLRRLREQIGFKLTALMEQRATLPEGAHEILLGDDLENDPLTYALYADALAGRIAVDRLSAVLMHHGVYSRDAEAIAKLRRELRPGQGVLRAFIRLERHTDPDALRDFAPGVVGCTGAFQMAVALWKLGAMSLGAVGRVALDLVRRGVGLEILAARLADLRRRAIVTMAELDEVVTDLRERRKLTVELREPGQSDPAWKRVWTQDPATWTPSPFIAGVIA